MRALTFAIALLLTAGSISPSASRQQDTVSAQVRGFTVYLLLAEQAPSATDLPAGVRQALESMPVRLPYRGYRMLDSQWLLCCGGAATTVNGVSGRLRGADDQEYPFAINVASDATTLPVRFVLRDDRSPSFSGGAPSATDLAREIERERLINDLRKERDDIELQISTMVQKGLGANHPDMRLAETRRQQIDRRLGEYGPVQPPATRQAPRPLIDTTFSMGRAETVVVGTSSLRADRALVVVLAAVPRSAPSGH